MKRLLTTAAAAALISGPLAAGGLIDPPVEPYVPPPAPIAAPSWSGAYAGVQLGYGTFRETGTAPESESSILYGLHLGAMHDMGSLVLGAEIDFDLLNTDFFDFSSILRIKGRLGYDAGGFLPYLTGGFAIANIEGGGSTNGWVAGAGVSMMATERWMIGVEGLYHRFNDFGVNGTTFSLRASYRF